MHEVKRWIGKNNLIGRLRYWYYNRRGFVHGDIFYRPSFSLRGRIRQIALRKISSTQLEIELVSRGHHWMTITSTHGTHGKITALVPGDNVK